MSDTSSETGAGVSMSKPAARPPGPGNRPARRPVTKVPVPRMINFATAALALIVIAAVARALLLLGSTPQLRAFVIDANKHAKKPDKHLDVAKAIHTLREGAFVQAAVFAVALLLLGWALRSTRTASATRWGLLIVVLYTQLPFYVVPTKLLPVGAQAAGVVIGVASIAALLLVFVTKESQQYFRACREASLPPEMRGQPRPGFGSLFGPKRPRGAAAPASPFSRRPAPPAATSPTTDPPKPKAKAKVRADTDAVAKGAELARSRAKASKSRRTPA